MLICKVVCFDAVDKQSEWLLAWMTEYILKCTEYKQKNKRLHLTQKFVEKLVQ